MNPAKNKYTLLEDLGFIMEMSPLAPGWHEAKRRVEEALIKAEATQ